MAIAEMFLWWYAHGWAVFVQKMKDALGSIVDFFSMSDLLRTLFQPFRQISASTANTEASLDIKFHMFIDRLVSRAVGFFSRLVLLIIGCVIIVGGVALSLVLVILWPIIPLLPIAGIILTIMGINI